MAQYHTSFEDIREDLDSLLSDYRDLRPTLTEPYAQQLLDALCTFIQRIRLTREAPRPQEQAGPDPSARLGASGVPQHKVLVFRPRTQTVKEERI